MTRYLIILFSIIMSTSGVSAVSIAEGVGDSVRIPDEMKWTKTLENACVESARRNNAISGVRDVGAGCACVARNVLKMASFEESVQDAVEDLNWVKRYFSGGIGQRELQKDPLALFQFIDHFGNKCAKNSHYEHNFGPGL